MNFSASTANLKATSASRQCRYIFIDILVLSKQFLLFYNPRKAHLCLFININELAIKFSARKQIDICQPAILL